MEEKVPVYEKFSLAAGLAGQNVIYGFIGAYFMFFLTDLLGVGVAVAGIILTVASVFDAITDPIMGLIADRTRTRWGKFRPYLLFTPSLFAIAAVICFTKFDLPLDGVIAVAMIAYVFCDLAYTFSDIPIWGMTSVIHENPKIKTSVITWANFGATFGTVFVTVLGIQVLNLFGGEREPHAFFMTSLIFSVAAVVLMTCTGLFTKERVKSTVEPTPFKKNIQAVVKNKPLLILLISVFCIVMTISLRSTIQIYYAVYVVEDTNFMTYAGLALVVGIVIGLSIVPKLIGRFYKKHLFIAASLFNILMSIIPYFIGYQNMWVTVGFIGVGFISVGMLNSLMPTLMMDCIDYGEWKMGFRSEGIVFSIRTFISKLCAAIARGATGFALVVLGFAVNVKQTSDVMMGLHGLMFLFPAILTALAIIPMLFFKFTEDKRNAVMEEIKQSEQFSNQV